MFQCTRYVTRFIISVPHLSTIMSSCIIVGWCYYLHYAPWSSFQFSSLFLYLVFLHLLLCVKEWSVVMKWSLVTDYYPMVYLHDVLSSKVILLRFRLFLKKVVAGCRQVYTVNEFPPQCWGLSSLSLFLSFLFYSQCLLCVYITFNSMYRMRALLHTSTISEP